MLYYVCTVTPAVCQRVLHAKGELVGDTTGHGTVHMQRNIKGGTMLGVNHKRSPSFP